MSSIAIQRTASDLSSAPDNSKRCSNTLKLSTSKKASKKVSLPDQSSIKSSHLVPTTMELKNTPTTALKVERCCYLKAIPSAKLLKSKPQLIESEDNIYQTLIKLREQISKPSLDNVDKMDTSTSDFVNQTLQRPVTWNDTQLDHFLNKRPHAEAECEICTEKLIMLNELDVQFLKRTFAQIDTKGHGFITEDEMKGVLIQWKKEQSNTKTTTYTDTTYFETFIIVEDGRINYEKVLAAATNTNYCQTLCVCRPSRWLHNKCLNTKLTMGLNGTGGYLLRCGYCRTSVWGTHYVNWLEEAVQLLNNAVGAKVDVQIHNSNKALDLAINAMQAVIRCGGGRLKNNAILGGCLSLVGSATYKIQNASNCGYPLNDDSGKICLIAMEMMGPPSLRTAWIMSEMRWIFKEEDQQLKKIHWLNLAIKYCKEAKRGIPSNQHALHMRAECMLLEFKVFYPFFEVDNVMEVLQAWPWEIDVLNTDTCFLVCSVMAEHFGVRHMGMDTRKYYERGVLLDPILFEELKVELDSQIHDDVNWMKSNIMDVSGKVTDEDRVKLGDEWDWEKHVLDIEVIKRLIQAYNTLHQYEKGAMWQEVIEIP